MANHESSKKRIRQDIKKNLHNKYYAKTMRNAIRKLRGLTEKAEASEFLPKVIAMIDKVAKRNIIHNNKASNLKSQVAKVVNAL